MWLKRMSKSLHTRDSSVWATGEIGSPCDSPACIRTINRISSAPESAGDHGRIDHERRLKDWKKSRERYGCPCCSLVLNALDIFTRKGGYGRRLVVHKDDLVRFHADTMRIEVLKDGDPAITAILMYIDLDTHPDLNPYKHGQIRIPIKVESAPCSGSNMNTCLDNVVEKYKTCIEQHHMCSTSRSDTPVMSRAVDIADRPPQLPYRVIDLAGDVPRLIMGSGIRAHYISLSHRWQKRMPQTTGWNQSSYMQAIPLRKLPKTFLDAFEVAKLLQIRYIWIDCFCIVQDSGPDKAARLSEMADIFSNCIVCFAVTTDHDQGLFYADHHADAGPHLLPPLSNWPLTAESKIQNIQLSAKIDYGDDRSYGVLGERGWCHQELYLATRVIAFYAHQMHWICSSGDDSCMHGYVAVRSGHFLLSHGGLLADPMDKSEDDMERLYDTWRREVYLYTSKSFTYSEDRLQAFSGMARRFSTYGCGSQYLAGIWQDDAALELCWYLEDNTTAKLMFEGAPTFSWMSVMASIEFEIGRGYVRKIFGHRQTFEFIRGYCNPATADVFGKVSYGQIELRGHAVAGSYTRLITVQHGPMDVIVVPGCGPFRFNPDVPGWLQHGHPLVLLEMFVCDGTRNDPQRRKHAMLVLQHSSTCANAFERVGYAKMEYNNHSLNFLPYYPQADYNTALWEDIYFENIPRQTLTIV